VADRIQLLAVTQQKGGVVIHLEPANLGSITLVVKAVASNITAEVTASDDHVRTALEQSRDQLGQQLQSRGYHLTSVSVGSTSSSSSAGASSSDSSKSNTSSASLWQGTAQQQQQQQQQARSAASAASRAAVAAATDSSTSRQLSSSNKGLDVWI
jgi:flagellar hook-length control protein FliK